MLNVNIILDTSSSMDVFYNAKADPMGNLRKALKEPYKNDLRDLDHYLLSEIRKRKLF